jgi:hypothetical protein
MDSVILFPPSHLFDVDFVIVPKRLFSSHIYEGYHTLVTYPTTFLKGDIPAGYLFLLLYKDDNNRRVCHVSSTQCWNIETEDIIEFITSFAATNEIDRIIVETYSPPPQRAHCIFPYSEVLLALPSNVDLSESLRMAHFKEIIRIPCYEFLFSGVRESGKLTPYGGTEEERQFYWEKWLNRPEALSIKDRNITRSLFIENYLYDFPFFSCADMVLFGKEGVSHWVPDIAPHLCDIPEIPYIPRDLVTIERVKIFRVAGEDLSIIIQNSVQYIFSAYKIRRFQLDNISSPDVLEQLQRDTIISDCTLLYERIILSKDLY